MQALAKQMYSLAEALQLITNGDAITLGVSKLSDGENIYLPFSRSYQTLIN